jgi:hypothetical protein
METLKYAPHNSFNSFATTLCRTERPTGKPGPARPAEGGLGLGAIARPVWIGARDKEAACCGTSNLHSGVDCDSEFTEDRFLRSTAVRELEKTIRAEQMKTVSYAISTCSSFLTIRQTFRRTRALAAAFWHSHFAKSRRDDEQARRLGALLNVLQLTA